MSEHVGSGRMMLMQVRRVAGTEAAALEEAKETGSGSDTEEDEYDAPMEPVIKVNGHQGPFYQHADPSLPRMYGKFRWECAPPFAVFNALF